MLYQIGAELKRNKTQIENKIEFQKRRQKSVQLNELTKARKLAKKQKKQTNKQKKTLKPN